VKSEGSRARRAAARGSHMVLLLTGEDKRRRVGGLWGGAGPSWRTNSG